MTNPDREREGYDLTNEHQKVLIGRFEEHKQFCRTLPSFYEADFQKLMSDFGSVVEDLLLGKLSKEQFLHYIRVLHEQSRDFDRIFYTESLEDLFILLSWQEDIQYALTQCGHENEHKELFETFQPKPPFNKPDVLFGVMILSDNNCNGIRPLSLFMRKIGDFSLTESQQKNPYQLYEEWDLETIKDFWIYLKTGVQNGSDGDKAILRN